MEDPKEEFTNEGKIHDNYLYQTIWSPVVDEMLECVREADNNEDRYAVAVKKSRTSVGHLPQRISTKFIRKGGIISCHVTGPQRFCSARRKRSAMLVNFYSNKKETEKSSLQSVMGFV